MINNESSDNKNNPIASGETEPLLADQTDTTSQEPGKKRKIIICIILGIAALLALITLFIVLFGKKAVLKMTSNYLSERVDYEPVKDYDPPDIIRPNPDKSDTPVKTEPKKQASTSHIKNILIIGIEEIKGAKNTDTMIIATIDTKNNTLKLVSLLRDLYVQVPGYDDNKLNSAYAKGGISLLYNTIETNFNIKIDNYVLINFKVFEYIIDTLGGIDIELSEKEADYLNTTNYISDPANRNVKPGKNHMNGNQALGYCRVRRVAKGKESNDFGRTQRQRTVIKAVIEKFKGKSVLQLKSLLNQILDNASIKTDADKNDIYVYLEAATKLKFNEIESTRIPSDGSYKGKSVKIGNKKQDVLVPNDWSKTQEELHKFIYE